MTTETWYVIVTGIKNGKYKKARFRQKDEEQANLFIENFNNNVSNTKSTAELLQENGWEKFDSYIKKRE